MSARAHELLGRLVRGDGDADAELEPAERAEGVEVGRVVARIEGAPRDPPRRADARQPFPCRRAPEA